MHPNYKVLENGFIYSNKCLKEFTAPKLQSVGIDFLFLNKSLEKFNAPKLKDKQANKIRGRIAEQSKVKISSRELAELDRETHLLQSEILNAKTVLKNEIENSQEKIDRSED